MVEGVTGAGKTSTINALRGLRAFELFDEEATFDDFVSGFRLDRDNAARQARDRMTAILDRIESDLSGSNVLLERFHFSQLALGSEWRWYRDIDDRCAALGVRVGVLFLPVATLESRSLYRAEYDGQDWQDLIGHYGSKNGGSRSHRSRAERAYRGDRAQPSGPPDRGCRRAGLGALRRRAGGLDRLVSRPANAGC